MKLIIIIIIAILTNSLSLFAESLVAADSGTLSQIEAEKRSEIISEVSYVLAIDTSASAKSFDGRVTIEFSLNKLADDLRIDSTDSTLLNVNVNGNEVADFKVLVRALEIPKKYLKKGPNKIVISYLGKYSNTGIGLHRFEDPEDKAVYLYSQFEPFDANRMFPCFDQPDLKAPLSLTVTTPKKWQAISTTLPKEVKQFKNSQLWIFKTTPKLSTYLYSLHAGPYKVFTSNSATIPSRLFVRASMAKYLRVDEWFKITEQGLKYFGEFFDYAYPFEKYDQIAVPEFSMGAMENTAAITFSESFLKRGAVTEEDRENLANTIVHEMAHMWFGDLVTMKWWDGLWLNESFASYMATKCLVEATEFKSAWITFYADMKKWAYWQDQIANTHAIAGEVKNTDEAFTKFDGITYGKGASVLKQLSYFVGEKNFQIGLQSYFKNYAYKNTEVDDFISEIAKAADKDLTEWSDLWLNQATPDVLTTSFVCENDRLKAVKVNLENKRNEDVRPHSLQFAMLKSVDKKFSIFNTQKEILIKEAQSLIVSEQAKCPEAIIPNFGDHAYLKVSLDQKSVNNALEHFSEIEDVHLRMMLTDSFWEMVRDQNMRLDTYKSFVLNALLKEKNFKILTEMSATTSSKGHGFNSVFYFDNADFDFRNLIEKSYWALMINSAAGTDIQRLWLENYIQAAHSKEALDRLQKLLSGAEKIKGQKVDQDMRWSILVKLAGNEYPKIQNLIAAETKKDKSARGVSSSYAAKAAVPAIENKLKWFSALTDKKSGLSNEQQESVMRNLFPPDQNELRKQVANLYFEFLRGKAAEFDENFLSNFSRNLVPALCDEDSQNKLQVFLNENKNLPASVLNELGQSSSENERCLKIRTFNKSKLTFFEK